LGFRGKQGDVECGGDGKRGVFDTIASGRGISDAKCDISEINT
jgi:hypothetical protein